MALLIPNQAVLAQMILQNQRWQNHLAEREHQQFQRPLLPASGKLPQGIAYPTLRSIALSRSQARSQVSQGIGAKKMKTGVYYDSHEISQELLPSLWTSTVPTLATGIPNGKPMGRPPQLVKQPALGPKESIQHDQSSDLALDRDQGNGKKRKREGSRSSDELADAKRERANFIEAAIALSTLSTGFSKKRVTMKSQRITSSVPTTSVGLSHSPKSVVVQGLPPPPFSLDARSFHLRRGPPKKRVLSASLA